MAVDNLTLAKQIYKLRNVPYQEAADLIYEWTRTKVIDRAHHQFLCEHHFGGKPITDQQLIKYIQYHEDNESGKLLSHQEQKVVDAARDAGVHGVLRKMLTTEEKVLASALVARGFLTKGHSDDKQKSVAFFLA